MKTIVKLLACLSGNRSAGKVLGTASCCALLFGCSTYYGYDDISATCTNEPIEVNDSHTETGCDMLADNGRIKLAFYDKTTSTRTLFTGKKICGKKHFYSEFDASYDSDIRQLITPLTEDRQWWDDWIDDPVVPFPFGEGCYFPIFQKLQNVDGRMMYFIFPVNQAADWIATSFALAFDGPVFVGQAAWTVCAMPTYTFCGKTFGFFKDWKLREHGPGPFYYAAYCPIVNLLFPFIHPPYYSDSTIVEKTEYFEKPKYKGRMKEDVHTEINALQEKKIYISVIQNEKSVADLELKTNSDGIVDLTERLKQNLTMTLENRCASINLKITDREKTWEKEFALSKLLAKDILKELEVFDRKESGLFQRITALKKMSYVFSDADARWRNELLNACKKADQLLSASGKSNSFASKDDKEIRKFEEVVATSLRKDLVCKGLVVNSFKKSKQLIRVASVKKALNSGFARSSDFKKLRENCYSNSEDISFMGLCVLYNNRVSLHEKIIRWLGADNQEKRLLNDLFYILELELIGLREEVLAMAQDNNIAIEWE